MYRHLFYVWFVIMLKKKWYIPNIIIYRVETGFFFFWNYANYVDFIQVGMYLYILFNKVKRIRIAQSKFTIYIVYIKTIIYHPRIRGYFVLSKIQNRVILSAYLYCVE